MKNTNFFDIEDVHQMPFIPEPVKGKQIKLLDYSFHPHPDPPPSRGRVVNFETGSMKYRNYFAEVKLVTSN